MTEKEVDVVAEELARIGGASWYPGRSEDPVLRVVTERFRERARAAIAALDRYRQNATPCAVVSPTVGDAIAMAPGGLDNRRLRVGATVIYRPAGDRRAYSCIVDKVDEGLLHIVPQIPGVDGWVREPDIVTTDVMTNLEKQGVMIGKAGGLFGGSETDHPGGRPREA